MVHTGIGVTDHDAVCDRDTHPKGGDRLRAPFMGSPARRDRPDVS